MAHSQFPPSLFHHDPRRALAIAELAEETRLSPIQFTLAQCYGNKAAFKFLSLLQLQLRAPPVLLVRLFGVLK